MRRDVSTRNGHRADIVRLAFITTELFSFPTPLSWSSARFSSALVPPGPLPFIILNGRKAVHKRAANGRGGEKEREGGQGGSRKSAAQALRSSLRDALSQTVSDA